MYFICIYTHTDTHTYAHIYVYIMTKWNFEVYLKKTDDIFSHFWKSFMLLK